MRVGGEMSRQLGTGRPVKKRSALQGGPNKMYPDTRVGMGDMLQLGRSRSERQENR